MPVPIPFASPVLPAAIGPLGGSALLGAGPPGELAAAHVEGLLSFLSPARLISDFLSALSSWVISGAAGLLSGLGASITTTTKPQFGAAFGQAFSEVTKIAAALAIPFLVLAIIQSIFRQDLSMLLRAAFVRLPIAFLLAGAATELVSLSLGVTDECCNALLSRGGPPVRQLVANLVAMLGGPGSMGQLMSGFSGIVIAVLAVAVALLLWVELAVRSAAVMVATLFLPIALAGLVWSATSHWARRLAETLGGLVLAKLVVVGVLVLAAGFATPGSGVTGLAYAIGLLAVAAASPFVVLRLLPMIDSGALGHLEGVGRRGMQAGRRLAASGGNLAMAAAAKGGPAADPTQAASSDVWESLEWLRRPDGSEPMSMDDPRVFEEAARQDAERAARAAAREAARANGGAGDGR